MSKMTPWFPPHIKPVRKGVYQIKYTQIENTKYLSRYATWNGTYWSAGSYNMDDAYHQQFNKSIQNKFWRGFTEEQK